MRNKGGGNTARKARARRAPQPPHHAQRSPSGRTLRGKSAHGALLHTAQGLTAVALVTFKMFESSTEQSICINCRLSSVDGGERRRMCWSEQRDATRLAGRTTLPHDSRRRSKTWRCKHK